MHASKFLWGCAWFQRVFVLGRSTLLETTWVVLWDFSRWLFLGMRILLLLLLFKKSFLLLLLNHSSCGFESCLIVAQWLVGRKKSLVRLHMVVEALAMTDASVLLVLVSTITSISQRPEGFHLFHLATTRCSCLCAQQFWLHQYLFSPFLFFNLLQTSHEALIYLIYLRVIWFLDFCKIVHLWLYLIFNFLSSFSCSFCSELSDFMVF